MRYHTAALNGKYDKHSITYVRAGHKPLCTGQNRLIKQKEEKKHMLNPKIVYIAVAMVFLYLVAKFKLVPYLAARRILKDAKKDNAGQTPETAALPALLSQTPASLQALLAAGAYTVPPIQPKPERRDMYFDYCTVETMRLEDSLPLPHDDVALKVDAAANQLLVDLRKRGICPNCLSIVPVCDGLLMVYATYIL